MDLPEADLLVSGAGRCADDSIIYSTKKGTVCRTFPGKPSVELYSAEKQKDTFSIPWWVSADVRGNIYFSDLGTKSIKRIVSGGLVQTVLSKESIEKAGFQTSSFVYYRFSVNGSGILSTCNDYYLVSLSADGKNILRYTDGGKYSAGRTVIRIILWLVFLSAIGIFLTAIVFSYFMLLKRRMPLMLKQLLIFVPMVIICVAIPSKLLIDDYSQRYTEELNKKISLMVQLAPKAVNPDDIQSFTGHGQFLSDEYRRVRNSLLEAFNFNKDEWNRGFYFVLYQVKNNSLYGCMYLNGSIGMYYPFNYFDNPESIYHRAYKGEIVTESVSDVWGKLAVRRGSDPRSRRQRDCAYRSRYRPLQFQSGDKPSCEKDGASDLCHHLCVYHYSLSRLPMRFWFQSTVLRNGVNALSQGEWDTKVKVSGSRDEIDDLAVGFNKMSEYILKYISDIVNLNNGYHRFVPEQFLLYLEKEDVTQIQLGDQVQKTMTVMFSDIRSFTTLSEKMTPKENFDFLNSYLKHMGPVIRGNKGFIDKYIGDAIMALFPYSADDALSAALQMFENLTDFNARRMANGEDPIAIGLGLHTGQLMLGVIGEEERMDGWHGDIGQCKFRITPRGPHQTLWCAGAYQRNDILVACSS